MTLTLNITPGSPVSEIRVSGRRMLPGETVICVGTESPPSLAAAVANLGEALGVEDEADPTLELDPGLESSLARLVDCVATHSALLPEIEGGRRIYVTGISTEAQGALAVRHDALTIGYDVVASCRSGDSKDGVASGVLREHVEPFAGPAEPVIDSGSCELLVPNEL